MTREAPARARPPTIRRDALDAQDFEATLDRSAALSELAARGAKMLPDFRELLGDLFSACVKLAVEPVPARELPPSARVRGRLDPSRTAHACPDEQPDPAGRRPAGSAVTGR